MSELELIKAHYGDFTGLYDPSQAVAHVKVLLAEIDAIRDLGRERDEARAALAAVEQDRDRLSEELTVVRRERAWLLQLVGYDELQEFRLLAQTAERARVDAKDSPRAGRFEDLLADPNEQFDRRGELLASVAEYMNAPPAAATAQPKRPSGTEAPCGCSFERWGRDSFKVGVCDEHSGAEAGHGR